MPTAKVRVMSEKQPALEMAREDVTDEVIVVLDAAGAGVVTVRGLRTTRDDQVVGATAMQSEGCMGRPLQGGRR